MKPPNVNLSHEKNESTVKLMNYDKNPLPQFDLFPRLMRLTHFIFDQLHDPGLSDHARGAGPALDAALYDGSEQLSFPVIERPDAAQLGRTAMPYLDPTHQNRWDESGRYYED